MSLRKLVPLVFALLILGVQAISFVPAAAGVHLAQEEGTENENAEGGEEAGSEGQSGADAETGAGEGETEEATEEEGPPWTYQMARISIVMILGLIAGVGLLYYKLIASRQKGTT